MREASDMYFEPGNRLSFSRKLPRPENSDRIK